MDVRDESWLQQLLDEIWDAYFGDVPQDNDVRIVFGRRAKRRLGSIAVDSADGHTSVITMNGLFRMMDVPEFVIRATLAHELIHYAHGFNSPLEQRQQHPHAGGVMRREFAERGLLDLYLQQKRWLKDNWAVLVQREFVASSGSSMKGPLKMPRVPKPFWFIGD